LRRETRAEKRREEIKKSIRVVGVPEGVEAGAGFGGSGSEVRVRCAEGRRSGVDENVNVGVRLLSCLIGFGFEFGC
jgi:hypothetical protein